MEYIGKQVKLERFEDTLTYIVTDANFAVEGSKRYQNVSFTNSYLGGRLIAGFFDRVANSGQLHESKPLIDKNVIKISQISLSKDGQKMIIQFVKNSAASPEFEFYTFTAILLKD